MNIVRRALRTARRELKRSMRKRRLGGLGLCYVEPTYIYKKNLPGDGVVIDVGCSYEAEFSRHMIERHGFMAYGVDPTRKHRAALQRLEQLYKGRFIHIPLAISVNNGVLTFNESKENESGSILEDHVNVRNDDIVTYDVDSVDINSLLGRLNLDRVSMLKLDLEGAEYDLLRNLGVEDLSPFDQIFVEFHHHAIEKYSKSDTAEIVSNLSGKGFNSYTLDDHNYLFYR